MEVCHDWFFPTETDYVTELLAHLAIFIQLPHHVGTPNANSNDMQWEN